VKRVLLFVWFAAVAVCRADTAPPAEKGLPPLLPYQMRALQPTGDRQTGKQDGPALFSNRCGGCHLAGGMGTNLLTKQRVAAGEAPESGLLVNRKDLTVDFIKAVVRRGKLAMPRLTRVDVTDAELDAIAHYLGKSGG
jgi:mono/diheme cytochrome c family protein